MSHLWMTKHEQRSMANAFRWAPDKLKQHVLGENYDAFVTNFAGALQAVEPDRYDKDGNRVGGGGPDWRIRTAMLRLYAEMAQAVGTSSQLIVNLHASMGVRDEDEMRRLVEAGRRVEQIRNDVTSSAESIFSEGLECVKLGLSVATDEQREKFRSQVLTELGLSR